VRGTAFAAAPVATMSSPVRSASSNAASTAVAATPRGLVWASDDTPGIRRERRGDAFVYRDSAGRRIRKAGELRRIQALAVPPAYEEVWICALPNGHLQATGRDARGRKQYRYHPEWRLARDADKFERMVEFGAVLPRIRVRVKADLAAPIGTRPRRDTVLATIVRLLDTTLVRIGNDEYTRTNKSFGLTTLRNRHAAISGSRLRLRFRGKSGVERDVDLDDPRVAHVVRRCQAMPGQQLFQYEDESGLVRAVDSADVNDYIRAAGDAAFTAKDFRTWHGSAYALELCVAQCGADPAHRRSANQLLAEVARRLGNTVAVCKKSYVHPRVLEALASTADAALSSLLPSRRAGLTAAERRLLQFLSRGK
jgi:DNA topoisomerase I